jgi:hypothetical protein
LLGLKGLLTKGSPIAQRQQQKWAGCFGQATSGGALASWQLLHVEPEPRALFAPLIELSGH